jgi:hypothetical protein
MDVSEERRLLQEPHDITPKKMAFSIVTAVKTPDLNTLVKPQILTPWYVFFIYGFAIKIYDSVWICVNYGTRFVLFQV